MRIGIIGSGFVAQTLGGKLLELGHDVTISSRDTGRRAKTGWGTELPSPEDWAREHAQRGRGAGCGSFADAATFGEVLIIATAGAHSLEALASVDASALTGKTVVDLSNPLQRSGTVTTLSVVNTTSVAEEIQAAYPEARVVKTLNTVNVAVMIDPASLGAETDMFVSGNDPAARQWVSETLLKDWLGWTSVLDLGDITAARAQEMYLPLWLRLLGALGSANINVKVVKAA
jgi:8-hydroxy-5-deazaflavin:NADPH oxidoreductase